MKAPFSQTAELAVLTQLRYPSHGRAWTLFHSTASTEIAQRTSLSSDERCRLVESGCGVELALELPLATVGVDKCLQIELRELSFELLDRRSILGVADCMLHQLD